MTTRSTAEAMTLLDERKGDLIERARVVARRLAKEHGVVHSRQVRAELVREGTLDGEGSDFWLGVVFRHPDFQWTGSYHAYSDATRNIHERTIKIWRLRDARNEATQSVSADCGPSRDAARGDGAGARGSDPTRRRATRRVPARDAATRRVDRVAGDGAAGVEERSDAGQGGRGEGVGQRDLFDFVGHGS